MWWHITGHDTSLDNKSKGKGKVHPITGHERSEGEQRYSSTLSLTSALHGGGWSMPHPNCFTPRKETWHPLYRRLGGPQSQSGRVQKISSLTGFDPPTVQPIVSHYTDYQNFQTNMVPWNVRCQLSSDMAPHPCKTKTSTTPIQKPKFFETQL
jgi:hypothetical protein